MNDEQKMISCPACSGQGELRAESENSLSVGSRVVVINEEDYNESSYCEKGLLALTISPVQPSEYSEDAERGFNRVKLDYEPFREYNKKIEKSIWYGKSLPGGDSGPNETATQSGNNVSEEWIYFQYWNECLAIVGDEELDFYMSNVAIMVNQNQSELIALAAYRVGRQSVSNGNDQNKSFDNHLEIACAFDNLPRPDFDDAQRQARPNITDDYLDGLWIQWKRGGALWLGCRSSETEKQEVFNSVLEYAKKSRR